MEKTTMMTALSGKRAYVAPDTIVVMVETAPMMAFSDPTQGSNGDPYADPEADLSDNVNRSRNSIFTDFEDEQEW